MDNKVIREEGVVEERCGVEEMKQRVLGEEECFLEVE